MPKFSTLFRDTRLRDLKVVFAKHFDYLSAMRKRGRIILAAVILVTLAGLAWWGMAPHTPDPVYDGHPLSWLVVGGTPGGVWHEPANLDTNALPPSDSKL